MFFTMGKKKDNKRTVNDLLNLPRGWVLGLGCPGASPRLMQDQKFRLYVFDSETLDVLAGATTEGEGAAAKASLKARGHLSDGIASSLGTAMQQRQDSLEDEKLAIEIPPLALLALLNTQTAEQVQRLSGGLAGHWLCSLYRLENAESLSRPAFRTAPSAGLLTPEEVVAFAEKIVTADLSAGENVVRLIE